MDSFNIQLPGMRVARFSLNKGEEVPLHMHEGQHAFSYLLSGKCIVTNYNMTKLDLGEYELTLDSELEYVANDYCELTPVLNVHKIKALEDSSFLDSFAPGVEGALLSDYLKVVNSEEDGNKLTVIKIPMEEAGLPERWFTKATLDKK